MLFIIRSDERPAGYVHLSTANTWVTWLNRNIPESLHADVRHRLNSNLKHLLVGLELKAALIEPHAHRAQNEPPALFEPYFQNLILEFGIATFSVLEGLGAAHWLDQNNQDGINPPDIHRNAWRPVLSAVYDPNGEHGLDADVVRTLAVRDLLHQDRLGARADIHWHAMSYDAAFEPASRAVRTLLRREADAVPAATNLNVEQ
jgi:hypothetical protein